MTLLDRIQVWCDVGGTFTDCVLRLQNGTQRSIKVLSHGVMQANIDERFADFSFETVARAKDPGGFWNSSIIYSLDAHGERIDESRCVRFEKGRFWLQSPLADQAVRVEIDPHLEAPVLATRLLLGCTPDQPLPPLSVRLGTTRGTNALLTRNGARTAFITTQGFADLLAIGYQERPSLFELNIRKRAPLYEQVMEVDERLDASGSILKPLDMVQAESVLRDLYSQGFRSLAVCLIHAYVNPLHERLLSNLAHRIGFTCISLSHEVSPMIKAVARGETAVVDAYLTPVVRQYLMQVREQFQQSNDHELKVMTSAGGLVGATNYRGKDSVLSGPAGGAVALKAISNATQIQRLIGLDMGGTSTDVCRVDGELDIEYETVKAGVRMMTPTLRIHTVAAGGGSICWFDGVQLRVGPQSAGSKPGPACYGRGGPLTITDLNLLSGRIDAQAFPFPLDFNASQRVLHAALSEVNEQRAAGEHLTEQQLIDGFRIIANEHMASAVRSISIAQGADPREHTLVCFGGAAGQHICDIADRLGMDQILDPVAAGLLSAVGIGMASVQRNFSSSVYKPLSELQMNWLSIAKQELWEKATIDEEEEQHLPREALYRIEARFIGTDGTLSVHCNDNDWDSALFESQFRQLHQQRFGFDRPTRNIEIAAVHATFREAPVNTMQSLLLSDQTDPSQEHLGSIDRHEMKIGRSYSGPLLVKSPGSTTFVDRGWIATPLVDHTLVLRRSKDHRASRDASSDARSPSSVDPVLREVLAQRIGAIAEQMGTVLEHTAMSVNVKDRRDFSCAVFNERGELIANAPHVPVHLGAMSATVQSMMKRFERMKPGDSFITNDPYQGGSHLPDVTVVTPVFCSDIGSTPDFFVACRAHHAEIGGIAPGSMAPTSNSLAEEGVLIPPMVLTADGRDHYEQLEGLLTSGRWPTRALAENMADIAAQQAANQYGLTALTQLCDQFDVSTLREYMQHIQEASEVKTLAWIRTLKDRVHTFQDWMDDGTEIRVSIRKNWLGAEPRLLIDFSGTGKESQSNLNANPAIVAAAVIYVVRCAIADDLPLNAGVMRCIDLVIPPGILNPQRQSEPIGSRNAVEEEAAYWPAVAGGNVETSQRVVDCLLGALELAASSQGTMNNFLFGNGSFGYYETIAGGSGATENASGVDAVHTHMTNTRLTDVEVLEKRYPVRLVEFAIRKESGGEGVHRGGNGLIRQVQSLTPLTVSLVTSRRSVYTPRGLQGGGSGAIGENWWIEADGTRHRLSSSEQLQIAEGDSIRIVTPGGGGYGS